MNSRPVSWGVLFGWIVIFVLGTMNGATANRSNALNWQNPSLGSAPLAIDAPSDITLSHTNVAENQAVGTLVGTFATIDPAPTGVYTYTLVSGLGGADNASFHILTDTLRTNAVFDYQVKNSYNVLVQANDGTAIFTKGFTITVTNLPPVGISLDKTTITENLPILTPVGKFTTTDPDPASTYTYTLVSGPGSDDNASFIIERDMLLTNGVFQYTTKKSYSIRVQTDDGSGGIFAKSFTITVLDLPPTDIALSNTGITKNKPLIGTFSTTDPSIGDTHTYSLVSGPGDADNAYFVIVNDTLTVIPTFNYRLKNSFNIRVRATDSGGLYFEKEFTLYTINQPPKALDDPYPMRVGETLSITLTGVLNGPCPSSQTQNVTGVITVTGVLNNDCDPDQDPLTAVLDSPPPNKSFFHLNSDGTFTYTPKNGFVGIDKFTYRASDGLADSNLATGEITVLDLQSPIVFWMTPVKTGEVYNASNNMEEIISLSVDATDNVAVDQVLYYRWDAVNNEYITIAEVPSPPYRVDLAISSLNPGWNQIFVRAEDTSGNWSNRIWIWVLIHRTFLPAAIR
ncbi:MAG TPA: Ig-like domain-containing protein [Anaerolineales bacterium]